MEITQKTEGTVAILYLTGRLDLASGNELKTAVKEIFDSGKNCIQLNLSKIEFINSSGLGALVSIMKETRLRKGRLTLSNLANYVQEIFEITQLSHIFEIFPTQEDALSSFQLTVS